MISCYTQDATSSIEIIPVIEADYDNWLAEQDSFTKNFLVCQNFKATSASLVKLPNNDGQLANVILGVKDADDFWAYGDLSKHLPEGVYHLNKGLNKDQYKRAAVAFGLGSYQFTPYKKQDAHKAQLFLSQDADWIINHASSLFLVRDLINTPTEDMGPAELAEVAVKLAKQFKAEVKQIIGDDLLTENYPTIHTVGRASAHEPRLVDLRWGNPDHPKVTLVGKGVTFDSGGMDMKTPIGMAQMKKDMAGAAHIMGLARMIMANQLPIRLRVLFPAVENAISSNAYRPGDIITTRKGTTVEITNTDAEGRLVLCDALAEAVTEKPDLLIDIATLTGGIALGEDIISLFSNSDNVAEGVLNASKSTQESMWRLPLHDDYMHKLKSNVADMKNSHLGIGGTLIAAIYLKHFVPDDIPWLHLDIRAWNSTTQPGRPEGGEAMTIRSIYQYLDSEFG